MKIVEISFAASKQTLIWLFVLCIFFMPVEAISKSYAPGKNIIRNTTDTSITAQIAGQLNDKALNNGLYFPVSAKRFYEKRAFAPVWTVEQKDQNKTWAAMLLIDCVLQFGLRHEDYHPKELQYTTLHTILEQPGKVSNKQKARFEIFLTDAMLAFMNNLHFGKLNPYYPPAKIDRATINGFNSEEILTNALKLPAFMDAVVKVQPLNKEYAIFQHQLHLIKGLYEGDCYETPEADVRKIAVNMERLRWAEINDSTYIQINIPTYTLKLVLPDTTFNFKIVVGAAATPTPLMVSTLTDFATGTGAVNPKTNQRDKLIPYNLFPKQKTGNQKNGNYIYFMPGNKEGVELLGLSDKNLFRKQKRATSNGAIRIERGEELAKLLLATAGNKTDIKSMHRALMDREIKVFQLQKPVPIRITYITTAIADGQIVKYEDIYNLDSKVENQLYGLKPVNKTK